MPTTGSRARVARKRAAGNEDRFARFPLTFSRAIFLEGVAYTSAGNPHPSNLKRVAVTPAVYPHSPYTETEGLAAGPELPLRRET